jgi:hypothetical protein
MGTDAQTTNLNSSNLFFDLLLASGRAFSMTALPDGSVRLDVPAAYAMDAHDAPADAHADTHVAHATVEDAHAGTHADTDGAHATMRTQPADEAASQDNSPVDGVMRTTPTVRTQRDTHAHANACVRTQDAHDDLPPALAETLALFQGDASVDKFSAQRDLDISVRAAQCRLHRLDVEYGRIEKQDTRGHYRLAQSHGADACVSPVLPCAAASSDQHEADAVTLAGIPEQKAHQSKLDNYVSRLDDSAKVKVYSSVRANRPPTTNTSTSHKNVLPLAALPDAPAEADVADEADELDEFGEWVPPQLRKKRPPKRATRVLPEDVFDDDDLDYYLLDEYAEADADEPDDLDEDDDEQETDDDARSHPRRHIRPQTAKATKPATLTRAARLANDENDPWITG